MPLKNTLNQGLGVLGSSVVSIIGYLEKLDWLAIASGVLSLLLTGVIIYKTMQEAKITRLELHMKELEYKQKLEEDANDN